ncbi:MAG TPA: phosphatase PAP2 family protein [Anaerolineae bacterium]|nr:phosphatase PAP2 family protein [Anaerolineae bacterium]
MNRQTIALWISRLGHPFLIAPPALIYILWLGHVPLTNAILWTILASTIVLVPCGLYITYHIRGGKFADFDVSVREHRPTLYLLGISSILLLLLLVFQLQAPAVLQDSLIALTITMIVNGIINRWTKVSLHTATMAGIFMLILSQSLSWGLLAGLLSFAVGWSRVELQRHTLPQVILGWFVAVISVYLFFFL